MLRTNDKKMKAIDKYFERFADIIEGGTTMDFSRICEEIGVDEKEMQDYLLETFGLSGEDIVRAYRYHIPISLL